MHLNHILEQSNMDDAGLVARARLEGCQGPLVVGGSVADGLGTPMSDVDLVCFESDAAGIGGQRVSIRRYRWGTLSVDLHRTAASTLVDSVRPYRQHLLDAPPTSLDRVPYEMLVFLHAVHAGIPLSDRAQLADLADEVAADLYPMLLGLRALGAFLLHHRDGRQLASLRLDRPALAAARSAVEAVADAALAMTGRVNPNPKWRVVLLENAARDARSSLLPWGELVEVSLNPAVRGSPLAVLDEAVAAAAIVAERTELAIYHESEVVRALAAGGPLTDGHEAVTGTGLQRS